MGNDLLGKPLDPKFPDYVYAASPLVTVYESPKGSKSVAKVMMGEWMKILNEKIPEAGRIHVRYRGGNGYVNVADLSFRRFLEIYFIDVNQGDSILIQTPDDRRILIDGGKGDEALTFIRQKYNLFKEDNYIDFDAVIATHSDEDHTGGLIKILKEPKIAVKRFYHNGLFRRRDKSADPGPVKDNRIYGLADRPGLSDQPELTPLMKSLLKAIDQAEQRLPKVVQKMNQYERWQGRIDLPAKGFVCKRLEVSDGYLPPFNQSDRPDKLNIKILWPKSQKTDGQLYYKYYGDPGKTVNGNSIVLMINYGSQKIILTGDLNTKAMQDLVQEYHSGELGAKVYKAAHHGSQDFFTGFLQAVQPDAAVISSGDDKYDEHGHPRAVLIGTITRFSKCERPAVFITELAACYTPVSKSINKQEQIAEGKIQIYERSIQGIVHLRTDGEGLYLGTVHGRKPPEDPQANILWKWDLWPE
ncbi:MAG: MBL fold metallo-hydrolase [Acidobacteriota bacterium]|nr:MBL fold metallo-hydrolase [Acidobacteriota bacterium]